MKNSISKKIVKTPKEPNIRKPSLSRLHRLLMNAWRIKVRYDWRNVCAVCGATGKLDCHHIEGRQLARLRYDPSNGILLCPTHHKFGIESAHRSGVWFTEWLQNNHPDIIRFVSTFRKQTIDLKNRDVLDKLFTLCHVPCGNVTGKVEKP